MFTVISKHVRHGLKTCLGWCQNMLRHTCVIKKLKKNDIRCFKTCSSVSRTCLPWFQSMFVSVENMFTIGSKHAHPGLKTCLVRVQNMFTGFENMLLFVSRRDYHGLKVCLPWVENMFGVV